MKVQLAPGWRTELEHGPDWLFVKLHGPQGDDADATGLAEGLLTLLREELTRRMVLELEGLETVTDDFVDELLQLRDSLEAEGGLLRLCGLSREHQERLRMTDTICRLPQFRDREEAVMGFYRPGKPR
jgi:anti-anti-sigma regulatory factor